MICNHAHAHNLIDGSQTEQRIIVCPQTAAKIKFWRQNQETFCITK